jgi:hypothetical protein
MKSSFDYGVRWDYMGVPTVPNGLTIQPTNFDAIWGVSGPNNLFEPTAAPGSNTQAFATLDSSAATGKVFTRIMEQLCPFVGLPGRPALSRDSFIRCLATTGPAPSAMATQWFPA